MKWLLGLDRRTSNYILVEDYILLYINIRIENYILIEETKMKELRKTIRRAVKYKENKKVEERNSNGMQELDRRSTGKEESKWEKKRKQGK